MASSAVKAARNDLSTAGPQIFMLGKFFVRLEHARRADDLIKRDGTGEFEFLGELGEFLRVGFASVTFKCIRAEICHRPHGRTRTVIRPRETSARIFSRMRVSSISSSRGRLTEISACLRFTELSSTVTLNPSRAHSPRP